MVLAARPIGTRGLGDNTAQAKPAVVASSGDLAGTDIVTFSETATLSTSLRASDTVTFSETAKLITGALLVADTAHPEFPVRFREVGRLSVIVPQVAPPSGTVYVKRVSHTMPAPVLDANGRPT